ncbi:MAG: hypothetical protein EB084_22580 [Proteobacteria bacterium]|nr:hypothetical protein [Pseudomonadota bacterium]
MTEKLTDALYEEALARVADGNIDLGGTIGLRRWCDGSGPCAVETEPHGHWRGGVSVSTREVVLRLLRERDEARAAFAKLRDDVQAAFVPECAGCFAAWHAVKDAPTIIERHLDNCASHAGHACTCTYAPTIPSLGVKP